jgi:hypothetical protein
MKGIETAENQELALGMKLVSQLPEVMPDQANADVRAVYEDIQKTFRVPIVNFFFRVLANYPSYLVPGWREFGPCLRTLKIERAADELRSAALLEPAPDCSGVEWAVLGDLSKIRPFTDTIHYLLPKLLLVATSFHKGFQQARTVSADTARIEQEIQPGIAPGTMSILMVNPVVAKGHLHDLFESIKERHHHPGVATYYRSLGHWPDFLSAVWDRIMPLVDSPAYAALKQRLLNQASEAVEGFKVSWQNTAGEARNAKEISAICALFRFRLVCDLLIDVSLIKAMLDGPEAARVSHFSFCRDTQRSCL